MAPNSAAPSPRRLLLLASLLSGLVAFPTPVAGAVVVGGGDGGAAREASIGASVPARDSWFTDDVDPDALEAAREWTAEFGAAEHARIAVASASAAPSSSDAGASDASDQVAVPAPSAGVSAPAAPSAPVYSGTNHMWFPALGYDRSITYYPCGSTSFPANVVYRWGCAGANNVYLFGHAWGVMKPLHDAYVAGRLAVGMTVIYADAAGTVHTYRITTWRLVRPGDSDWAIAAQPVPSLTLQTCIGANSEWRLVVRLVRAS